MREERSDDGRPDGDGPGESRLERRLWIVGYVVMFLLIAAGATRQLVKLLG